LVPPYLQLITSIIGFESDQSKAIEELGHCIESKVTRAAEATLLMAVLKLFFLKEKEESHKLLTGIVEEYGYVGRRGREGGREGRGGGKGEKEVRERSDESRRGNVVGYFF
jgi:hypothetical protein